MSFRVAAHWNQFNPVQWLAVVPYANALQQPQCTAMSWYQH